MTYEHIHQEEADHVGEPEDADFGELANVAPPCDNCGAEAVQTINGTDYCADCLPEHASDRTDRVSDG